MTTQKDTTPGRPRHERLDMTIPDEAVEAAHKAWREQAELPGTIFEYNLRAALEAAAPHLMAHLISIFEEQIINVENTLVEECDYLALCAQREALINVTETLRGLTL